MPENKSRRTNLKEINITTSFEMFKMIVKFIKRSLRDGVVNMLDFYRQSLSV